MAEVAELRLYALRGCMRASQGRPTPRGRGNCGRPWAARLSDSFPPKHSASSLLTSQGSTVLSSKQNHCPPDGPCPCCFRTWRTNQLLTPTHCAHAGCLRMHKARWGASHACRRAQTGHTCSQGAVMTARTRHIYVRVSQLADSTATGMSAKTIQRVDPP